MNSTIDMRTLTLNKLGLSTRVYNCLFSDGVRTLDDLANTNPSYLLCLRNFGLASLGEVRRCLAQYGLALKNSISHDSGTLCQPGDTVFVVGASARGVILAVQFATSSFPLYTVAWWVGRQRCVADLAAVEFRLLTADIDQEPCNVQNQ